MKVENLKYYGKPISFAMLEHGSKIWTISSFSILKIMIKHLGFISTARILISWNKERNRLSKIDMTPVIERGLSSQKFIKQRIAQTAIFIAMERMIGLNKTITLHHELMDEVGGSIQQLFNPSQASMEELDSYFVGFSKFILAEFKADKEAGLHDYEILENSDNTLKINVSYCAFCEIPKLCGMKEACEPGCYSDEVFFPNYLKPLGIKFERSTTLARGGKYCDFKFTKCQPNE